MRGEVAAGLGPPLAGIIPVKGYVQSPYGRLFAFDFFNRLGQALGQDVPALHNADQSQVLSAFIALQNFMGNARKRAPDGFGIHDLVLLGVFHSRTPEGLRYFKTCPFQTFGHKKASLCVDSGEADKIRHWALPSFAELD